MSIAEFSPLSQLASGNMFSKSLNKTLGNPLTAAKIPQALEKYGESRDGTQQNGIHRHPTTMKKVHQIHSRQLLGKMAWCGARATPGPHARNSTMMCFTALLLLSAEQAYNSMIGPTIGQTRDLNHNVS